MVRSERWSEASNLVVLRVEEFEVGIVDHVSVNPRV